jgi:hypothetical protein
LSVRCIFDLLEPISKRWLRVQGSHLHRRGNAAMDT